MEVICLEEKAFYTLVEQVVQRLEDRFGVKPEKWVEDEEAKRIIGVRSKATMQKLRDTGAIRYTQPSRNIILYDRASLDEYLERHARNRF